jgi:DNA repair protein SbcD/Mre11
MRFIHTADWHLGRLFHGASLTHDQAHVLEQLVDLARDVKPDVILIAGDIYDRAVPPPEAVQVLDDVLSRLVIDLKVPVVLIAGNHDSPGRLNFGSRLLAERRLYVTGHLPPRCEPLVLNDRHGPVHIYGVPFAEPSTVRQCLECEGLNDHNAATTAVLDRICENHPAGERSVVVAHAFVTGGRECESERPLSVGGAGTVDASAFAGFHYAALGHLHSPQALAGCNVRYSGSLMSYSFDEVGQAKGVYVVEMDASGACDCKAVPLRPRRNVRRVSGLMADLLKGPADGESKDDYLEVLLLDAGPVLDAMGRLREVYPNVLHIRRLEHEAGAAQASDRPNVRTMDDAQLFRAFYTHVTNNELSADQEGAFATIVDELRRREREGATVRQETRGKSEPVGVS